MYSLINKLNHLNGDLKAVEVDIEKVYNSERHLMK